MSVRVRVRVSNPNERSKVKGHRPFVLIQLPVRVRVRVSFFLLFWNVRTTSCNFPRSRKENTILHFHPAARMKPSGRMFVHAAGKTHIVSLHYIENFSTHVVSHQHLYIAYNDTSLHEHREVKRSKGQGQQKHRRFLERSNEVVEFSINTASSKGQEDVELGDMKSLCLEVHVLKVCIMNIC